MHFLTSLVPSQIGITSPFFLCRCGRKLFYISSTTNFKFISFFLQIKFLPFFFLFLIIYVLPLFFYRCGRSKRKQFLASIFFDKVGFHSYFIFLLFLLCIFFCFSFVILIFKYRFSNYSTCMCHMHDLNPTCTKFYHTL